MKATAKTRNPTPVPESTERRRRPAKPELTRCDVRTLPTERPRADAPRPAPAAPDDWEPPVLRAGGTWVGGSVRREDIYDDDGR